MKPDRENPMSGILGGAAGNVANGGTVNPPRNRKGGAGNPPPTGARASALPDIYWIEDGAKAIRRANLDGSGVEHFVTSGMGSPERIALDVEAGKMYWTDWGSDRQR